MAEEEKNLYTDRDTFLEDGNQQGMRSFELDAIEKLIEYIPIECGSHDLGDSNKMDNATFTKGTFIDSRFYFKDIDCIAAKLGITKVHRKINSNNDYHCVTFVSFRDIVKQLNKFLKDANVEELINKQSYRKLGQQIRSFDLLLMRILFDFCLAAMEGDLLNAKFHLRNAFDLLGLHQRFYLLLSVIINEPLLIGDKDIREFLALLAVVTEPSNTDIHSNLNYSSGLIKGHVKNHFCSLSQQQILHTSVI